MRVAVYYSNQDTRIEERPIPVIGPGELLVKVEAAGICGSDVMEWYRKDKVPLVLGHEISGIVEEIGPGVKNFKKGSRVTAAHHVPCDNCHYCQLGHQTVCDTLRKTNFDPGGFAEFLRLPKINVEKGTYIIPDELSFDAATLVEPLACVLRGQRLSGGVKGKCVLVIGSGIAGILHILLARHNLAAHIIATDVTSYRLNAAKKFGAGLAIDAKEYSPKMLRGANQGRLADLVIICTGSMSAISQGLESVERGGTALFFAPTEQDKQLELPFNKLFWRNEITLTSSYAGSGQDYQEALGLIASGMDGISDIITHRFNLEQINSGFKLVAEAKESIKVIIYPQR